MPVFLLVGMTVHLNEDLINYEWLFGNEESFIIYNSSFIIPLPPFRVKGKKHEKKSNPILLHSLGWSKKGHNSKKPQNEKPHHRLSDGAFFIICLSIKKGLT